MTKSPKAKCKGTGRLKSPVGRRKCRMRSTCKTTGRLKSPIGSRQCRLRPRRSRRRSSKRRSKSRRRRSSKRRSKSRRRRSSKRRSKSRRRRSSSKLGKCKKPNQRRRRSTRRCYVPKSEYVPCDYGQKRRKTPPKRCYWPGSKWDDSVTPMIASVLYPALSPAGRSPMKLRPKGLKSQVKSEVKEANGDVKLLEDLAPRETLALMDANKNIVDAVEKASSSVSADEARQIMERATTANRLATQMLEKAVKQRIQLARAAAQSAQDRANLAAVKQALNAAKSSAKRAEDAGNKAAEALRKFESRPTFL